MSTEVYSVGLVAMSVCSDDTSEEIMRIANMEHPTGISSRWTLSDDSTFASGDPNPGPCEQDPSRQHYLLVC
jgi:hypothetical protein